MRRFDRKLRRENPRVRVWMAALVMLWVLGCRGSGPGPAEPAADPGVVVPTQAGPTTPIRVAAASDLQSALPKLVDRFKDRTGIAAVPVFLSSGQLAQHIRQGAPYDVFLSANEAFVRELAADGLIRPETVHAYARGSLVLAVYRDLGDRIGGLADLVRPEVKKIAIANPATAPYGKAGKQALERSGLWSKVETKIVMAESVRQALLYAQKGDAEAALVGRAIASVPEVRPVEVDPALYDPIVQALGIVAATRQTGDAKAFTRFVLDEEGQTILKEFGFKPAGTLPVNSGGDERGREKEAKRID
ncbi:MAG: molybdate ABC transporter substrate-binding protein [Isosphaeraceae bacterium]